MKKDITPSSSPDEDALVQRVDAMMGVENDKVAPTKSPDTKNTNPAKSIDIFKETKTAPEVSAKILRGLSVASEAKTVPVSKPEPDVRVELSDNANVRPPTPNQASQEILPATDFSDKKTDEAVDDIIAKEGDELLAAQDAASQQKVNPPHKTQTPKAGLLARFRGLSKLQWLLVGALLLLVVAAVPQSRYLLVGTVYKKQIAVTVIDSKTKTPVSNAELIVHGVNAKTDAEGRAQIKVRPGSATVGVQKQYYKTYSETTFVGLSGQSQLSVQLVATGRQVPVTVSNSITGLPLAGVTISILNTTAKTNSHGLATIVLPASAATRPASLSLKGYNNAQVVTTVTDVATKLNNFKLTPSGHIYFLSNLSGTIDIVRTNLDGTDRKTVLTGTGKEDSHTTSLLASRDWRYLVLKSRRDTAQPALYLVDTETDKVTPFETGDSSITLVGWHGHNFMYDVVLNTTPAYQSGHEVLKSYNAELGTPSQLDQTQAIGDAAGYAYQTFANFYILDNSVTYTAQWYSLGTGADLTGKTDAIRGVQPGGQNKKDYQTFSAAVTGSLSATLYEPREVYYAVYNIEKSTTNYYHLKDNIVAAEDSLSSATFDKTYPTYILSPSSDHVFWTELLDGKNGLFVGNAQADKKHQIANPGDYAPYGWFGDTYVLVSKNASELYILPANGVAKTNTPLKITDYYKPDQNFAGYGYGYGGL